VGAGAPTHRLAALLSGGVLPLSAGCSQQLRSSGDWFKSWPRGETNAW
jgi:hypothetical protein